MKIKESFTQKFRLFKVTMGNGEIHFRVGVKKKGWFNKWDEFLLKAETIEEAIKFIDERIANDNKEYLLKKETLEL